MSNYHQDFNRGSGGFGAPVGGPTPGWHAGNNQRLAQEAQQRQQQQFQENMRRQQREADERRRQGDQRRRQDAQRRDDDYRRANDSRSGGPVAATAPPRAYAPPRPPLYQTYPWLRRFSNVTALVLFLLGAVLFTAGGLTVEMKTADLVPAVSLFSLALAAAGKLLPLLVMRFARLLIVLAIVAAAVAAISFALEKT